MGCHNLQLNGYKENISNTCQVYRLCESPFSREAMISCLDLSDF